MSKDRVLRWLMIALWMAVVGSLAVSFIVLYFTGEFPLLRYGSVSVTCVMVAQLVVFLAWREPR